MVVNELDDYSLRGHSVVSIVQGETASNSADQITSVLSIRPLHIMQSMQSTDLFFILSGSVLRPPQTRRMSYPILLQKAPWTASCVS